MRYTEDQVVAEIRTLTIERLRGFLAEGWIVPATGEAAITFTEIDVARVRLVCELTDDMAVGDEAVPVILSLIDQVHGLRAELKRLARAVEKQPDAVRTAIRREIGSLPAD